MSLKPGDTAPDITLRTLDGQMYSLRGDQQGGRNTLLIFLRHLG
jgi:peroxiredoxin